MGHRRHTQTNKNQSEIMMEMNHLDHNLYVVHIMNYIILLA